MPVSSVIFAGIGIPGFAKVEKVSVICPFSTFTAPISVILSRFAERPVVSISKQINVPSSGSSLLPETDSTRSSIK